MLKIKYRNVAQAVIVIALFLSPRAFAHPQLRYYFELDSLVHQLQSKPSEATRNQVAVKASQEAYQMEIELSAKLLFLQDERNVGVIRPSITLSGRKAELLKSLNVKAQELLDVLESVSNIPADQLNLAERVFTARTLSFSEALMPGEYVSEYNIELVKTALIRAKLYFYY